MDTQNNEELVDVLANVKEAKSEVEGKEGEDAFYQEAEESDDLVTDSVDLVD